jgi:hypothetical protein
MRKKLEGYGVVIVFCCTLIGSLVHMYLFPQGFLSKIYDGITSDSIAFIFLALFALLISLMYAKFILHRNKKAFKGSIPKRFSRIPKRRFIRDRRTGVDRRTINGKWTRDERRSRIDRRNGIDRRSAYGFPQLSPSGA